jgi:hypothetical protein
VSYTYDFAVVAPRIRERILLVRFVAIEPKSGALSQKMRANKRLHAFAVGFALDFVSHKANYPHN